MKNKVILFAEQYNKAYFQALNELEKDGEITLYPFTNYLGSQIVEFITVNRKKKNVDSQQPVEISSNESKRTFLNKLTDFFSNDQLKYDLLLKPYRLLHIVNANKIIFACSPFHSYIYLASLISLFKKSIILSTSWPYWEEYFQPYNGSKIGRWLWYRFIKKCKIHTVSQAAKKNLLPFNRNITSISHPVDTSIFTVNPIKHESIRVLFAGRLEEQKGIRIICNIIKKNIFKELEFWFVGKGTLENEVLDLAKKNSNIVVLHHVNDKRQLAQIYNSCDIFLLPSFKTEKWEELFGIVLLEAMACALPVITTDCIGPKEIITNNVNGLIVPQKNENALIEALNVLKSDRKMRKKIAENGYDDVKKNYSLAELKKRWIYFLNN